MDTCAIEMDENEKSSSMNFIKSTEKTLDTY